MVVTAASQQPSSPSAPLTLTLQDALSRARANSIQFQAAQTDAAVAHQDTVQARAGLLPSVNYHNEYLFTQGTGGVPETPANPGAATTGTPRFIANNAVHEYASQGIAEETLSFAQWSDYRRARALEAVARAKSEIASRGLVVTVVQDYYGLLSAQRKYANAQLAATEAQGFLDLSRKLEHGGEVAHSDVIKAQIQANDRQRDLREAQLAMDKARLELAVMLFPSFEENFTIIDDAELAPPLSSFEDFAHLAQANNTDVRLSNAALNAAGRELASARAGYLPSLTLDYFYGIDAPQFATHGPDGVNNLGYSASATLNIPIWNWGATRSKVLQAGLRQKQAQRELSLTQRKLLADIRTLHAEAAAALAELDLLKSSADLAAEGLRLTNLRYQGGEATVLEVVDAQNTLMQARNSWSDGAVRYRTALANLQTLTGTM
ncbi:MAG TPA: TolC family protein [Candidatus Limnocylindrales bacterium]|jgi:outer membrane protein TolC|nr:TolC family protein [Candidatus Limnocylindrales bacterium]